MEILKESSEDKMYNELQKVNKFQPTGKVETDAERELINKKLSYPDMRPCDFDGSLEAWLLRISLWGDVTITRNHPEDRIKGKVVGPNAFLDRVGDYELTAERGFWSMEQLAVDKIAFSRKYLAYDGKQYKEEFIVEIKLKSDLQKAVDGATKKGFFGLFKW